MGDTIATVEPAPVMALAPRALRASINLGNAVLTNGDAAHPGGIIVDLAAELARRSRSRSGVVNTSTGAARRTTAMSTTTNWLP